MVYVNENTDTAAAMLLVYGTFMCGASSEACLACHPSCKTCDSNNKCQSCADKTALETEDGTVCLCHVFSTGLNYQSKCGSIPCAGNCQYCVGTSSEECMLSQEQADFVVYVKSAFSLPLATETTDHLLCFNQPRLTWDTSGCASDPLQAAVTGTITGYNSGTGATPTQSQCYELLSRQWFWLIDWFDTLFPNFTGPAGASADDNLAIKSAIYLWILNFGPSEMSEDDWTELKGVLTNASSDWSKFLGWVGESPKYVTAGTSIEAKSYPTVLEAWLKSDSGCGGTTAGCADLAVFNLKSTLCASACLVQSYCAKVDSTSYCAQHGAS